MERGESLDLMMWCEVRVLLIEQRMHYFQVIWSHHGVYVGFTDAKEIYCHRDCSDTVMDPVFRAAEANELCDV